ncbi:MAG: lipoic acid synthetase [Lysobacterales bacterium]
MLTIGQYLKPTDLKRHIPIEKFYTPAEFKFYKELGMSKGFKYVQSGPKVRSSFIAEEGYKECMKILQTVS